jgi:hypothetical protein
MGFEQLPAPIQQHIGGIARELGKNEDQGFLEELGNIWQRKATLFQEQARAVGMSMVEELPEGDPRGALFLTYSGSLLSVGPIFEGLTVVGWNIAVSNYAPTCLISWSKGMPILPDRLLWDVVLNS